jgi:hypothetical protein
MKPSNFFLIKLAKFHASALALGTLLFAFGCGSDAATKELEDLTNQWPVTTGDAGAIADGGYTAPTTPNTPSTPMYPSYPAYDAGSQPQSGDGDGDDTTGEGDSGAGDGDNTGTDAGPGGGGLPNLFGDGGIFNPGNPTPATPDAGTPPAGDPNGPCSALNLICFDAIDMFIHPECLTCNNGKGCQGCFITAY